MRKFDPDQPRDDGGRWSGGGVSDAHRAQADSSLQDRDFVAAHAERLSRAGDEARTSFPRSERAGDRAHAAAQHAIREEAARIHAEREATNGDSDREDIAAIARLGARDKDLATQHERVMSALADEHQAAQDEQQAALAGHIGDVPSEKHNAFMDTREHVRGQVEGVRSELDRAHEEAALALDRLHAYGDHGFHGLKDEFGATSTALAQVSGSNGRTFDSTASESHEAPDREDYASAHDYENARAHHENQQRFAALRAQSVLERLHEAQASAKAGIKAAQAKHDKAHASSMHEVERIDSGDLVHAAHHDNDRAWAASERRISRAVDHRERARLTGFEDAHSSLHDETKSTAAAIRDLAKITGRRARLTKANRPIGTPGATVLGMAPRFKLQLDSLKFISLVDTPAQETATLRLLKRDAGAAIKATARLVKISDGADPLAYFWAFTCTNEDGTPYHDLQGDAITDDFIKAAEEFVRAGAPVDEMHDEQQTSHVAFAFPMDSDIARGMFGKAIGDQIKTSGLMVAVRPAKAALEKLRSGEYTGVSIAGTGTREVVGNSQCASCGAYGKTDDTACAKCGAAMKRASQAEKAVWSTAYVDQLPDNAFLHVEGGGEKDSDGKTTPRSLRHFPYKDASGSVDIVHLRNAIAQVPKSSLPEALKHSLQIKAEKILAAQHDKAGKRFSKMAVLTSSEAGHQHSIDLDDPADGWRDSYATSYQVAEGADIGHSHAWVFDLATGKITIAEDSGHTHTVDQVIPSDVIARAALIAGGNRCRGCGEFAQEDSRFCPSCGASMSGAAPVAVVVNARAPEGISPPESPTPTVKFNKEPTAMTDFATQIRELEAQNARLEKMATLTDAQRAHYSKLSGSDAQQFLSLSPPQRDAVLNEIAKSDEVIYTSTSTGREYRKSAPLEVVEAAKQSDAMAQTLKRLEVERKDFEYAKRGDSTLSHFAKGAKGNLRARIMKALDSEFTEVAEHEEVVRAMKGADYALAELENAKGVNPHADAQPDSNSAQKRLEAKVNEFAKANNMTYPVALVKGTDADPEIRRLYNEAQLAGN